MIDEKPATTAAAASRSPEDEIAASPRRAGRSSSRWTRAVVVGVCAALMVAVAGLSYVLTRPVSWSAHRNVVVVPATTDLHQAASLYDSLSRGQVVATAAELYGESRWHPDTPEVTVTAGSLPPSAVVQITATGGDKAAVEATVQAVVANATAEVNTILRPYQAVVIQTDPPIAHQTGLGRTSLGAVVLMAALLGGVAAAGLAFRLPRRARPVDGGEPE